MPSRPSWSTSGTSDSGHSTALSTNGDLAPIITSSQSPQNDVPASPPPSSASSSNVGALEEDPEDIRETSANRAVPALSANHYVEAELLFGVSLGFSRPAINTILSPMVGQMPTVITLPYGKSPVFHLQTPNWRQMLKLMARLSGTRVEPTLEALTVARHELKLRTVIQFVKLHHSASEWRTVIYLTTEMPLPPSLNNAHKYTNGDVTILPYSYTLSPLPTLLRDGAESPMAKYYVVPATNSTPYPTLPMNFPSLAMYLQSAVQDSRRAANDSSSGMRKLANYIDTCYANDFEANMALEDSDGPRKGVGGMFKRVMGRGKAPKGRGGNDEVYDLVTPFVMEEWG
ncbi:hypothetical protein BJ138DRAFT_1000107 [Hygrophoropsis aurantiaca]|uniref:Uncharacterized protein n=1 Tax=Hygrophoropsis aurantiaca TaxID=72124 RepID=A0ACB8ALZ9_9AGAM|nr:hypothetical protein BJ138DRAFT_1000107 [Hygrophoropsis aurantiaca]